MLFKKNSLKVLLLLYAGLLQVITNEDFSILSLSPFFRTSHLFPVSLGTGYERDLKLEQWPILGKLNNFN